MKVTVSIPVGTRETFDLAGMGPDGGGFLKTGAPVTFQGRTIGHCTGWIANGKRAIELELELDDTEVAVAGLITPDYGAYSIGGQAAVDADIINRTGA